MSSLTPAQLRVLRLTIGLDLTHREAATRLGISPKTVQAHVEHAYERLGVSGGSKRDASLALGWGWPPSEVAA